MKNIKYKLSYVISMITTVLFISCSGDDGATGPPGADGQNGKDGIDGNANVVSVLVENSSFVNGNKTFTINAITQNILNDGVVLVYMRVSSVPSTWYSLPYFFGSANRVSVRTIKLNEVTINANYNSSTSVDYKFVIIAGNNANASKNGKNKIFSTLENNGIDVNDYNQVARFYNLKE